jgi:EpsI family protein
VEALRRSKYISLLVVVSALIAYTYSMRYRTIESPGAPDLGLVSSSVAGFTGRDETLEAESLLLLGADATLFRTYRREGSPPIWLFLGYFGSQQEYSQIHSPKNCYPGAGWNILREGTVSVEAPSGALRAKRLVISDGIGKRIVVYWFSTPAGALTDEFALKWYQTKRSLFGKPQESTFVRFSTPVPEGMDESTVEGNLLHFIESMTISVESVLGGRATKGYSNGTTAGSFGD